MEQVLNELGYPSIECPQCRTLKTSSTLSALARYCTNCSLTYKLYYVTDSIPGETTRQKIEFITSMKRN